MIKQKFCFVEFKTDEDGESPHRGGGIPVRRQSVLSASSPQKNVLLSPGRRAGDAGTGTRGSSSSSSSSSIICISIFIYGSSSPKILDDFREF